MGCLWTDREFATYLILRFFVSLIDFWCLVWDGMGVGWDWVVVSFLQRKAFAAQVACTLRSVERERTRLDARCEAL